MGHNNSRRHALGQHFLKDKTVLANIETAVRDEIDKLSVEKFTLLEVGPGKLALTKHLSAVAQDYSSKFILVEHDRQLEKLITNGLQESDITAELNFFDAASDKMSDLIRAQSAPIFLASNLPYSASSQILAQLCLARQQVLGAVVMVQKELAQRMAAPAGHASRGAFSVFIQSYSQIETLF